MKRNSLRILHIEDDGADRDLLERAIRRCAPSFNILSAIHGDEAFEILLQALNSPRPELPDVILLDLNLPRKDGRQFLIELKEQDRLKMIPVVILTTSNAPVDIENCYRHGAACYLVKPLEFNELVELARKFIGFWLSVELVENQPNSSNA